MAPHSLFKHHTLSPMPISVPPFSPISYCSVAQLHPNLCNLLDCSVPGLPVPHLLLELTQVHVHWIRDDIQPSHPWWPLLLLPSVFPSIRNYSNELSVHFRWPKYWSFSFSSSSSREYSGFVSLKIDWFDLALTLSLKTTEPHQHLQSIYLLLYSNSSCPHFPPYSTSILWSLVNV